ncbi:hypothetical protein FRC00_003277 [Tulasnella sp. 408]|nr:hypothetical protein FRC00_003277 [Tulasnella sp. 408]
MIRSKKIYILLPQRLNNEDFNDDPEKLMGLPPTEKTTEFWKRYDRLADTHDAKMTEDLSENLDVLLIFAALFSAINTAFISLTMPGLSSDPLTENNALLRLLVMRADNSTLVPADLSPPFTPSPNSVIVNCLLYASLSCSLLAAVAAMMGKEWLQSFDRTGQTGPLEEQGRFRQRKFDGVLQWHLESIIRSLPNILLLSVILFFAGICLFLFPVNRAVAGVVSAFSGGGAVLGGVAIVAGAAYPLCPYQSAASRALGRTGFWFSRWSNGLARAVVDHVVPRISNLKLVRKILDAIHHHLGVVTVIMQSLSTMLLSTTPGEGREAVVSEQTELAQAAGWLLTTTSNRADQIAAAQFICALDSTAYVVAFKDSETRRRLVFSTHEAFDIWYSRPTKENQDVAELLGLVLCRVLLQTSNNAAKAEDITNLPPYQSKSFGGTFLRALAFASTKCPCHRFEDKEMILHIAFLLSIFNRGGAVPEYQWARLSRFFLTGNTPRWVNVLVGLWARMFSNADPDRRSFDQSYPFNPLTSSTPGESSSELVRLSMEAVLALHAFVDRKPYLHEIVNFQGARTEQLRVDVVMTAVVHMMTVDSEGLATSKLLPRAQPQALAWVQGFLNRGEVLERVRERVRERVWGRGRWRWGWRLELAVELAVEQELERELEQELEQELERELEVALERGLERGRGRGRGGALAGVLVGALAGALAEGRQAALEAALEAVLDELPDKLRRQVSKLADDLAQRLQVEMSILRILLWVWKTSGIQLDHSNKRNVFISSCRLWAPLETIVDFTINGIQWDINEERLTFDDRNRDKVLTSDDLNGIVEFVEDLQKDRGKSEFIARNADVGINRLCVHFNRRVEWDYDLYDLREQVTFCPRSGGRGLRMIW